jgi:hypothetical protein
MIFTQSLNDVLRMPFDFAKTLPGASTFIVTLTLGLALQPTGAKSCGAKLA